MIKIKIKNHKQIVASERSWLISKIAPIFVDLEQRVEEAIVQEIKNVFERKDIEAQFHIVREDGKRQKNKKSKIVKKPARKGKKGISGKPGPKSRG
ncbi:MAG: hypothetical protein ACE5GL_01245 [Calditrichia bacterium]